MSAKFIPLVISSVVALVGCTRGPAVSVPSVQPTPAAASETSESDQYAVYDAALNTYVSAGTNLLVIDNRGWACDGKEPKLSKYEKRELKRTLDSYLDQVSKGMPGVTQETIEDFRGKRPVCLTPSFNLPVKYVFISDQELDRIFSGGNKNLVEAWKEFRAKYPGSNGILSLSNVGFNREMNQALVEVDQTRGSLDGVGRFFLLKKESGRWEITGRLDVWYS